MRVFYDAGSVVSSVTGGILGGAGSLFGGLQPNVPDVPSPAEEAKKEAEAAEEARRKALAAAQAGTGRQKTLLSGGAGAPLSQQPSLIGLV